MKKVYDHAVYYNGVFYSAGTPIEVKEEKKTEEKEVAEEKTAKKTKKAV